MAEDAKPRPVDGLKSAATGLLSAMGDRAMSSVRDKVDGAAGRLTDYVKDGGGPGLAAALTGVKDRAEGKGPVRSMLGAGGAAVKNVAGGLLGKGGGGGNGGGKGKNLKVTNIVEAIDVGAPIRLVYNQWTQFADFPSFMKKVESVEQQEEEQTLNWKAQILWSHRNWEATIQKQVPDDKIIWRSKGSKGSVDGAVTFHELAPNLTRILVVLEYHPQGFFEGTGNLWRAQGRRARLELKHFRRHVMSEVLLHPDDEVEGWRGVIEDGEVVKDHETALKEEQEQEQEQEQGGGADRDGQEQKRQEQKRPARDRAESEHNGRRAQRPRRSAGSDRPASDRKRRPARAGARGGDG